VATKRYTVSDYVLSNRLVLFNLRIGLTVLFWGLLITLLAIMAKAVILT